MAKAFFVVALAATAAARAPWAHRAHQALAASKKAHKKRLSGLADLRPKEGGRSLVDTDDAECLASFVACETDAGCLGCVVELVDINDDAVDLPEGAESWQCPDVVSFLHGAGFCRDLESGGGSGDALCSLWAACALAVQGDDEAYAEATPAPAAACSATECVVPHEAWLGDGRCDDGKGSCYNTAACGWDGGDCCAGTCASTENHECGEDRPFACRDPEHQGCGSRALGRVTATAGEAGCFEYAIYSMIGTSYAEVHSGMAAMPGAEAAPEDVCLADGCYVLAAKADKAFGAGGAWAVEVPDGKGNLVFAASGAAPAVCTFPVGSPEYCPNTCAAPAPAAACAAEDQYLMELFDSGLNGWGFVGYSVHKHDAGGMAGEVVREGTLADGPAGLDPVCLPDPGCYTVTLQWGWWSEEVSWVLGKEGEGAVAQGGAPAQCDFSAGGDYCPSTCAPPAPDAPQITGGCDPDDASKLPYTLELYDAEGDGWRGAMYSITGDDNFKTQGTLPGGFQGEDELCLASGCYDFDFDPGRGANDKPSWALGDPTEGGVVFSGADSAACTFAVGGGECPSGPHAKAACGFGGAETPPPTSVFECAAAEALVVLRLVDSFGDGWNGASVKLTGPDGAVVDEATLADGAYAEYPYCVDPGCYRVEASSGEFREEVSWQAVELLPDGGGVVRARGAAPESCGIALAAGGNADAMNCDTGCATRAAAEDDWIGKGGDDYWEEQDDDAYNYYYDYGDEAERKPRCTGGKQCSVAENFQGWNAATELTNCLNNYAPETSASNPFEPALWEERPELCLGTYDFGELDAFEACAAALQRLPDDLKTKNDKARECMALLVSAVPDPSEALESPDELVKRLATMVYYAADTGFCDCASDEKAIPHCADFDDFRAVVRESHEACDALDAIDCAYLGAYADACRTALVNQFGALDLSQPQQCAYVVDDGCAGLALPSVRRWDCLLQDNYELTDAQRSVILDIVDDCYEEPAPESDDHKKQTDDHYYDTDDAAAARHHHHSSTDEGMSGGAVALIVILCLVVAGVGGLLSYMFFVKGRTPRHVFGGAYGSDISMPSFSPLPTENPMRAPLSSSGYYEAPTGV